MLRDTTIAAGRAWNTWSSLPGEMVFLPLGVRLAPMAFAGSTGAATLFPAGPKVRFGRHAIDGGLVELELNHAGTVLDWSYGKATPFAIAGAWHARQLGEWGLRFWINLCLRAEGGQPARFDPHLGVTVVQAGSRFVALATAEAPVQVTGHATLEAAAAQYEARGYFDLSAQALEAPVLALRFNLEMARSGRFAMVAADSLELAARGAHALLAEPPAAPALPTQTGNFAGSLDAVRDVVAWNTVWDEVNDRCYTSISRNWNLAKFGGFGVWLNDQQYAALLAGLFDQELAQENLATALASATPQGNLACLLTANDAWVDRTQLPVGSFLVWLQFLRSGSRAVLERAYDTLARNHRWWWANRDPDQRGLVSFGTSDVGSGLYKGTSFGARNESSMDNAPHHDEAEYDPATRTLTTLDVGLNSLLALDGEMLAAIATALGHGQDAAAFAALASRTRSHIRNDLWDEQRGLFANRLRSGAFVRSVGPTSFYPLVSGAPTPAQAARLVAHLDDPATFGGRYVIPGVSRDDPAFPDNSYWRGRVWPPLNFWVWQGLRRTGFAGRADRLAADSVSLFRQSWDQRRLCPENFNATSGEPLDQPDTDGFYTWGALMPFLGVAQVMDVSPWHGWQLVNGAEDATLGPIQSPIGLVGVIRQDGWLTLTQGGRAVLATNVTGTISHLVISHGLISMELPPAPDPDAVVTFPALDPARIVAVRLAGEPADWQEEAGGTEVGLAASGERRSLSLHLVPER